MERDFKKELKNFPQVWQRVEQSLKGQKESIKLMPGREKKKPAARFTPPGKRY